MTYGDIRDTRWYNPYARARTKVLALLFLRCEAPISDVKKTIPRDGCHIYEQTPGDDCPIRKVMTDACPQGPHMGPSGLMALGVHHMCCHLVLLVLDQCMPGLTNWACSAQAQEALVGSTGAVYPVCVPSASGNNKDRHFC